ncbi:hypothetical protein ABIE26_002850 [Pedobacter africanus]|uniref:DNA-damage-inducible protein D n=1 Tax=Pedobacter africanus TaxID=151894 RepID=A0ACC6KX17_9SPHI|nr:hypothetical protein [Pedobacter africanus]MDR6783761.1 DNA-damage-inducible protein D [Pedobacter africanus]
MKTEEIKQLFEKFESAAFKIEDIECWSGRELQEIFQYKEWRNFVKVIDKAKEACKNGDNVVSDHFVDVNKMVELGSGSVRQVEDIALTIKKEAGSPGHSQNLSGNW